MTTLQMAQHGSTPFLSVREHVRDRLRQAIIGGQLGTETRLHERSVAQQLGVSTTPVKDAFLQLESEGFLRSEARRGVFVAFGPRQAQEMILARGAIEGLIAGLAARHGDSEEFAAMADLVTRMRIATQSSRVEVLVELNRLFHRAIHRASRAEYLVGSLRLHAAYHHATRMKLFQDRGARERALAEHDAILERIVQRREEAAEQAMRDHVVQSGAIYIALLFGDRGTGGPG